MKEQDCEIGRRMEITMAEVTNEVKHIKEEQLRQGHGIDKILDKFDLLDKKYASKVELKENALKINSVIKWAVGAVSLLVTSMFSVIMFLIKQ